MSNKIAQRVPGDQIHIVVDSVSQPFFDAGKEGRLEIQQCSHCSTYRFPPAPFCGECQSEGVHWVELSGRARIYTFAVAHRSPFRGTVPDFTYVPVVLELVEAPHCRVSSNIVDIDPDEVKIGMEVEIFWGDITDGWKVPLCRAVKSE